VVSKPEGSVTIGGPQGFRGVVDEFGVYDQDPAGRPSTDPDLYARAQAGRYGEELVFATGFDGMSMPSSFTLEGRGTLAAGSLRLAPGAHLALPAIAVGDPVSVTIGIGAGSARRAELRAQWQGESQAPVVVPAAVTRTAGALGDEVAFRLSADGGSLTVTTPEGERQVRLPPPASGSAALVVGVGDPADAAADLVLDSVLAVRSR
jgi:hypothetical protein